MHLKWNRKQQYKKTNDRLKSVANIPNKGLIVRKQEAHEERKESFEYTIQRKTNECFKRLSSLSNFLLWKKKKKTMRNQKKQAAKNYPHQTKPSHKNELKKNENGDTKDTKFSKQFCIMRVLHLDDSIFYKIIPKNSDKIKVRGKEKRKRATNTLPLQTHK